MNLLSRIYRFYADGFRQMTWGRTLWLLIIIKLVILFAVLRVFFFRPTMHGLSDEEKSAVVGTALTGGAPAAETADRLRTTKH